MPATLREMAPACLYLPPLTAANLMSTNPVSIRANATVVEATALLTDRNFGAAPVIDAAGRPVGVVSRADILIHDRERSVHPSHAGEEGPEAKLPDGFSFEEVDSSLVSDIMTPAVFAVAPETPAEEVIGQMLSLHVHQLFVVDADRVLVGVISTLDILRKLRCMRAE